MAIVYMVYKSYNMIKPCLHKIEEHTPALSGEI